MAETTWNSDALCEVPDVTSEIGDSLIAEPTSEGPPNTVIKGATKKSGEIITDMLLDFLPDIYAQSMQPGWESYSDFYISGNYTQENLETMLDKVTNPECMKLAAVAYSVIVLIRKKKSENEFATPERVVMLNEMLKDWQKEFDARFVRAWRKLKIDLDQDGTVSNAERPRSQNSFKRV